MFPMLGCSGYVFDYNTVDPIIPLIYQENNVAVAVWVEVVLSHIFVGFVPVGFFEGKA